MSVKIKLVPTTGNDTFLPAVLERLGVSPEEGQMTELPGGEVRLDPDTPLRDYVQELSRRSARENRRALEILEAYDRAEREQE